jgi:integrase
VSKRNNGWQARVNINGREISKQFDTQDEAARWKSEQQRAYKRGEWLDPDLSKITFREWSALWLKAKNDIQPSTIRNYVSRLEIHLLPAFGKYRLTELTNNQIGQWVANQYKSGTGAVTLKQCMGLMKIILNSAIYDGRLARNPAQGIKLPKAMKAEKKALTFNELRALASECGEYQTLTLFAGMTGLRWGELNALVGSDVNLLKRTVKVNKSYSEGKRGEKILSGTKTHQAREIPLAKELLPLVETQLQLGGADSPLFQSANGRPLQYNNFMSRVFKPAVKRAGLEGVSFHNLRHTAASLLIHSGAPVTTVSGILGHASTQMTLDVYGHWYQNDANTWMDKISVGLSEPLTDWERTKSALNLTASSL